MVGEKRRTRAFIRWSRFRQLFDITIAWWTEIVALILLVVGLVGYFRGGNLYVPIFTEIIGIGIAVLLIDLSNKFLATRNEKKRLILQMGSPDNVFAREAVRQLRARGWLTDGSLRGAFLGGANLEEAILQAANLQGAELWSSNLQGAYLVSANLQEAVLAVANLQGANLVKVNLARAILVGAKLQGAKMQEANLEGAKLQGANLEGAKVTYDQLSEAKTLEGATMPDGTIYNPETFKESLEEQEPQV